MSTHQSPLISLPKKTTPEVDFTAHIKSIIGQTYGERPDGYNEECNTLNRCRSDAVKGAGSDATARDLLYKYFGQLEMLELRFADVKVPFLWNDAFTLKPTTQTSLAFEKASIIYLLSSTLSLLASQSPRSSPEGIKRAYNALRQSTGMLIFINDNFLHAPSTDLSREVVKFCATLLGSQAGEVFIEKCISEKKPAGLIARLCQTVSISYSGLSEESKEFQGKGIIERAWISIIGIKGRHFAALAQYYRAKHDDDKSDHGAAMARMGLAVTLAIDANRLAKEFTYLQYSTPTIPPDAATALVDITQAHLAICKEAKAQAQRDNDLVYHSIPQSEASLPPLDPLPSPIAAPITIQEIYLQPEVSSLIGPDIFRRLVPVEVHVSASVYSEEKAKLIRAETERCETSEGEVRAALEDLGLNVKLARFRSIAAGEGGGASGGSGGPSQEVLGWADEVRGQEERGGVSVDELIRRMETRRKTSREDLDGIGKQLEEESRECEKMRVKYASNWSQQPSASFTRSFREQIRTTLDSLDAAEDSDQSLIQLRHRSRPDIDALRGGSQRVRDLYSQAASKSAAGGPSLLDLDVNDEEVDQREREAVSQAIRELEERQDRLGKVRRERGEVLKDLKEKVQQDDVSNLLLLNRRTQGVEPTLFAAELEKFRPYQSRIGSAIASQGAIVGEMAAIIKQVESGRGVREANKSFGDAQAKQVELERNLRRGVEAYRDVRGGLEKGQHFYERISTLVEGLRRDVRAFLNTRDQERSRMAADAETRSRLTSPSGYSSPPPPSHSRDLESMFGSMSVNQPGGPSNPPTRQSSASPYPAPPPAQKPASPYDFGNFSRLPSSFGGSSSSLPPPPPAPPTSARSTAPPGNAYSAPPAHQAYSSLPPPPQRPQQPSYTSYAPQGGSGSYASSPYAAPAAPTPPPAPSPYSQPSYPAPPSAQSPYGASSPYGSTAPPPQSTNSPYGYRSAPLAPPPSSNPYASGNQAYPTYPQNPAPSPYAAPPAPYPPPPTSYSPYPPPTNGYGAPPPPSGSYNYQR